MTTLPILPNNPLALLQSYGAVPQRNFTEEEISQILDKAKLGQQTPSFSERLAVSRSTVPGSTVIPRNVLYPSEADSTLQSVSGSPYYDFVASQIKDYERPINRILNTANSIGDLFGLGLEGVTKIPYSYFTETPKDFNKTSEQYKNDFGKALSLFNNPDAKDWQTDYWRSAVNAATAGLGGGSLLKLASKATPLVTKALGQKALAETFYKQAGDLAARNAAGAFPATAKGVSKLEKQYVTQGNRAWAEYEELAKQYKNLFTKGRKNLGAIALGEGVANTVNATEDQTSAATPEQLKQAENNIVESIVNPAVGQDTGYGRISPETIISNPATLEQLRAAGLPDIVPALPETRQDLLRLLQETPVQNSVPITAAQAAQEYQQALRDRNTQGLTREEVLRQAMDKRQQALARINAERESNPLSWLGHILSLASAWRRREFNPSATWSNATLAQAALDPEYQEAEDTIRLLAPQYATSQQNLENVQKSAFSLADLASRDARTAAIQQAADASEQKAQAQVFRAMNAASSTDPLAKLSNDQLDIYENTLKKALAAAKSEAVRKQITAKLMAIQSTREQRQ